MLVAWALNMTPGTSNQVAISAMLVLALGASSPEYALDRVLETLIGAAIGIIVNALVVPPVAVAPRARSRPARRRARGIRGPARRGARGGADPAGARGALIEARLLRPMRDAADAAIAAGEESLTLNPRRSTHREELGALRELLDLLGPIVTQLIGMTRAFADPTTDALATSPPCGDRRAAAPGRHDVRLAVRIAEPEPEPMTSETPALTSALVIAPPTSGHWILVGSLMEDLRRIREELVGQSE